MIRAIIVDDEKHCRESLRSAIKKTNYPVEVVSECSSPKEALEAVTTTSPDLVFLDVEMGKQTGFDFLEQAGDIKFEIIFTTAHEGYALKAIKFCALDYLLKPIGADDLQDALGKFENRAENKSNRQLQELMHNMKTLQTGLKKIALPTLNGLSFVPVQEIIRCESDINYTTFHLVNKTKITVAKTLKDFEEMLEDYNFFRVHNSHLINLTHIKNYTKGEGGVVTMDDGSEIDVSRRRKDEFLKRIAQH